MIQRANRIQNVETYYFAKKLPEVKALDCPEKPVLNLGIGSPDLAPEGAVIDALVQSAKSESSHGYQSYKGTDVMRRAMTDFYHATYGVKLDPATQILPLMGSKEGIMHISLAFLNPGDEVLIPNPGYPTYSSVSRLCDAKLSTYRVLSEGEKCIDWDELLAKDLSKVKIMWVNFPHMPTGRNADRDELQKLVDLAREHQFLLVNDNPYSLILNPHPTSLLSLEGADEVVIELNSLSKSHNMAGWRVGWVSGAASFINDILKVKSNMDSGMFLGIQEAATQALKLPQERIDAINAVYAARKEYALSILRLLGCSLNPDQVGMFVWAKVPDKVTDVEVFLDEILYGTHVFLSPGFIFGSEGSRYVRISLCSSEEVLQTAEKRIAEYLKNIQAAQKLQLN
ncbi:MAG: aminotransferase class I/II-fold pyridoxal phosphate-dependent enzyme [Cyclobacteriaceae bacterium]|nr:aminotransferase class I/II-fold pyridoxal phosphate-dependent enzyme [Cyclobacteriaceae bacterium]MCH8516499.1 aminotransferase class I/II-fold pyridoxal phosphate-dependent enzyme [Cyclobacteriaceae bacterium]